MRKEGPLRMSVQTKIDQQPNCKKAHRGRHKRVEQINEPVTRKQKPHRRKKDDREQTEKLHSNNQSERNKKEFIKATGRSNYNATRQTNQISKRYQNLKEKRGNYN